MIFPKCKYYFLYSVIYYRATFVLTNFTHINISVLLSSLETTSLVQWTKKNSIPLTLQ